MEVIEGKSGMGQIRRECLYRKVTFESSLTRQVEYEYSRRGERSSQQKEQHKQRHKLGKSARCLIESLENQTNPI